MNGKVRRTIGERIRRLCTHEVGLKLFSLGLAIVMFSVVQGSEDAQRSIWVDVVALTPNERSEKILTTELPDRVRLIIKGSRSLINSVRPETLPPVQIDLTSGELSRYSFLDQEFELPAGVAISMIDPASIPLRWADRAEKPLPIVPRFSGVLGAGLSLGSSSTDPATVVVTGPSTEVDSVSSAYTREIDLRDFGVGRHVRRVSLERPPPHSHYSDEVAVRVTFDVRLELIDRHIKSVEVEAVGALARSMRPRTVDITLRGSPNELSALSEDRLIPFVDLSALGTEKGAVPMRVELRGVPEGIDVVAIEPAEVLVQRADLSPARNRSR